MAAQEIKPPRCKCGAWSELTVTPTGWYVVKCSSCGRTGEVESTSEYAMGSFLSTMYATPLECFIGCLISELAFELPDETTKALWKAAETHDLDALQEIAREEIRKVNKRTPKEIVDNIGLDDKSI